MILVTNGEAIKGCHYSSHKFYPGLLLSLWPVPLHHNVSSFEVPCCSVPSIAVINTMNKNSLRRKELSLLICPQSQSVIEGSQGKNLQAETEA